MILHLLLSCWYGSGVKKERFTLQASILWSTVPREAKERILKNCFCPRCRETAEMVRSRGAEKNGDLVLTGSCAKCGHKVVRIVETSEARMEDN